MLQSSRRLSQKLTERSADRTVPLGFAQDKPACRGLWVAQRHDR